MTSVKLKPLDWTACAGFLAYSASASITPITLVILLDELNRHFTEGGFIEAVRSVLIFAVLFASGFVSARFGKVHALGSGAIILALGLAGFALAPSYWLLLGAVALMGLGSGILEGLINPLIQDLHPEDSGKYLNFVNGFWSLGVLGTVLISGELLTQGVSWRLIAGGLAAYSFCVGILFFVFDRQTPKATPIPAKIVFQQIKDICTHPHFWVFIPAMFFAGGTESAFMFWSASLIQVEYGGLARAAGIGTACFAVGMIIGRFGAGWLVSQKNLHRFLLGSCLAGFCVSLIVFTITTLPALYLTLTLAGLAISCFWPSIQSYATDRLPVDSTILFILLSCAGIPGFAATASLMGYIADKAGLTTAFIVPPVMFLLLLGVLWFEARLPSKRP